MDYKKYVVKKVEKDLLSSLKAVDSTIIKEEMDDNDFETIEELRDYIIDIFSSCLHSSTGDIFTRMYFEKLVNNENTDNFVVYEDDIEALWVFVYKKNNKYFYYIPTEIREIIKKELNI